MLGKGSGTQRSSGSASGVEEGGSSASEMLVGWSWEVPGNSYALQLETVRALPASFRLADEEGFPVAGIVGLSLAFTPNPAS